MADKSVSEQAQKIIASLRAKPGLLAELKEVFEDGTIFNDMVGPWERVPNSNMCVRRLSGEALDTSNPIAGIAPAGMGFEGSYTASVRLYEDFERDPSKAFRRHVTPDINEAMAFVDSTLQELGFLVVPSTVPDGAVTLGYPRCLKCFEQHDPKGTCYVMDDDNDIPF
jgi:hypothetical protein